MRVRGWSTVLVTGLCLVATTPSAAAPQATRSDPAFAASAAANGVRAVSATAQRVSCHAPETLFFAGLGPADGSHSSSALAINTFGAWIGREGFLALAGRAGFTNLRFEAKFPTGLQGNPPNLDVVADSHSGNVAIESKCTEYLGNHVASFQSSYGRLP